MRSLSGIALKQLTLWLKVLSLTLIIACSLFLYIAPGIFCYHALCLQTFDYGIIYQSTYLASQYLEPLLTLRGVHALADNQEYLQFILSPFHYLVNPHYALITTHALAIWACGLFFLFYFGLRQGTPLAIFAWSSPFLLNLSNDLIHIEAFATILLLLCFVGARHDKPGLFFSALILALSCKEDIAFTAGFFCLLAYLRPARFDISRRCLLVGAAISLAFLTTNVWMVLPYFKVQTCEWISPSNLPSSVGITPASPFLSDIFEKLLTPSYYLESFLRLEVLVYFCKLFWPVLLICRRASWFALLPLPAALVNILSGNLYFIESFWHYDHSSFAMLMVCVILAFEKLHYRRIAAWSLALISLTLLLFLQPKFRPQLSLLVSPEKWYVQKSDYVNYIEQLELPKDVVISADFFITSYLLSGGQDIYSFPNPFIEHYFGLYGVCDKLEDKPLPHLVILRVNSEIEKAQKSILEEGYELVEVKSERTLRLFDIYVRRDSLKLKSLL